MARLHRRVARALLASLALAALPLEAEVYRSVDKDGHVIFSDRPSGGDQPVSIGPTNSMQPALNGVNPSSKPADAAAPGPAYQQLVIIDPPDGGTVTNVAGNILVRFELSPALREGDTARLLIDGIPGGMPAEGGLLAPANARGDHQIETQILDPSGAVVATSAPVHVTVFRPPPHNTQRRGPPTN